MTYHISKLDFAKLLLHFWRGAHKKSIKAVAIAKYCSRVKNKCIIPSAGAVSVRNITVGGAQEIIMKLCVIKADVRGCETCLWQINDSIQNLSEGIHSLLPNNIPSFHFSVMAERAFFPNVAFQYLFNTNYIVLWSLSVNNHNMGSWDQYYCCIYVLVAFRNLLVFWVII